MNELLTVENVSKTFGSVRAVNDVSMEVAKGEFLAIQGQSGSGKTTLLSLLSGLERADCGTISLDGKDITGMNEGERRDSLPVFQPYTDAQCGREHRPPSIPDEGAQEGDTRQGKGGR
jgi:ABC-type Fe3+/spermidine/putrescine transport system ATPase subunit